MDYIKVRGARQHNLKNIDVDIPKNQLVVFTGLSGSGKSSLAFDTIYAEGQRRYVESLSSYARQFLGIMGKPDVDSIDGLSPAISIDQKTTSHNPRSTVGTITEIYDYLRLLFARIGHPHCPNCGKEISSQSIDQIVNQTLNLIEAGHTTTPQVRLLIMTPIIRDKKGEFSNLFNNLRQKGIQRLRIDGHFFDINEDFVLIKTNRHTIDGVVDRLSISKKDIKNEVSRATLKSRLAQSVETALNLSDGLAIIGEVKDAGFDFPNKPESVTDHLFSERFACPDCNISLPEIEPRIFSFNSPHGACPTCTGLGVLQKIDPTKIIAPDLTLSEGAIIPFATMLTSDSWFARTVSTVVETEGGSIKIAWKKLDPNIQKIILYGSARTYRISGTNRQGRLASFEHQFEGIVKNLERRYHETESDFMRSEISRFMKKEICPDCNGTRLKKESLSFTILDKNISEISGLSIEKLFQFIKKLLEDGDVLSTKEVEIGKLIITEITTRLNFLLSVGLDYLTLSREAATLAGGEAQRIRLASQIGTGLTGVLYVLDEPSIGLHQRDNQRLIDTLKKLKDLGNTVIVVEHDRDIMLASDHLIDFGPKAGKDGGSVVWQGTPEKILTAPESLTGKYLSGKKKVEANSLPPKSKSSNTNTDEHLTLVGCSLHNLKKITVNFPLNKLIAVTGVSGSGKSTLIHDTLHEAVKAYLNSERTTGKDYQELKPTHQIDRISLIDQSPIGRTPRSNPATYTKIFDYIRNIFANTKDSKMKGFKPGRFSFNVKGGRCEACQGEGQVKIEMQFMPDVYITCEVCRGTRYNSETLDVHYKGKNIAQVLSQSIADSLQFFSHHPTLEHKLKTLVAVGLGYIELGQPAPTLSGGEAQRVKLARELSIRSLGHTLYLLDEPTTGLHFEDVKNLLFVLRALVSQGNTVVVIEHNLDIIKNADWIIDLGPEGGDKGGKVVVAGTPKQVSQNKNSYTGQFLSQVI